MICGWRKVKTQKNSWIVYELGMLILEKYKAWLEGYGRCKIQGKMKENEPIRKCIIFIKVEILPPPKKKVRNECWERVESKKNNGWMKIVNNEFI